MNNKLDSMLSLLLNHEGGPLVNRPPYVQAPATGTPIIPLDGTTAPADAVATVQLPVSNVEPPADQHTQRQRLA